MPKDQLLPGVTVADCPPRVVCDAKAAIRAARRRAIVRDTLQVVLIVAIDYLFIRWPESRVPFLDRGNSLNLLRAVNALVIADLWLARALPKWTAKRIAATWSRKERERFMPVRAKR